MRHYLSVAIPEHAPPSRLYLLLTNLVLQSAVVIIMNSTVKLDDQHQLLASEVCVVATNWMLSAEFVAIQL